MTVQIQVNTPTELPYLHSLGIETVEDYYYDSSHDPSVDVVAVTKAEKEKNKEIPADYYIIEEIDVEEII